MQAQSPKPAEPLARKGRPQIAVRARGSKVIEGCDGVYRGRQTLLWKSGLIVGKGLFAAQVKHQAGGGAEVVLSQTKKGSNQVISLNNPNRNVLIEF